MVDILLATYNGERYLKPLMQSLLSQEGVRPHIYIRDDGSADGTPALIQAFHDSVPDKVTIVKDGAPQGSAKDNFFCLMRHARAPYIMFADQDDIWLPDKAIKSLEAMWRLEAAGEGLPLLVHGDLMVVDDNMQVRSNSLMHMQKLDPSYNTPNRLLVQNNITGCATMVNRALLELAQSGEGDSRVIMHDWWLGLVAAEFGKIGFIKEPLIQYRQHAANEVGAKDVRSAGYIRQKVGNTAGIHEGILLTYAQAHAFYEKFGDKVKNPTLYKDFIALEKSGAWKRLFTLTKHRLYKSGLYRKFGQIVYG